MNCELFLKGYTHVKIGDDKMRFNLSTQETLFDKYWRTGNILVTRNHEKFLVINELRAIGDEGQLYGLDYTDSLYLLHSTDGSLDIMAVYDTPRNLRSIRILDSDRLLWEREE